MSPQKTNVLNGVSTNYFQIPRPHAMNHEEVKKNS
jgi:hypothetical protein